MESDEAGTLAALKALRCELVDPLIAEHRGRIIKLMGDGALVEFASVVDAVACAQAIQKGMRERNADIPVERRIAFRIGVHLGDVIVEDDDLYGDGVNLAARLEGLAGAGEVCISQQAFDQIETKLDFAYEDLGEQQVKNIARPVRVYRVDARQDKPPSGSEVLSLPIMERPAVAVLPFNNISGDPDQAYFADGLSEEIITALSLCRTFPVIARNSTFSYRGKSVDIRQVAKDLNAQYVLDGSVRKSGHRVRITAELVDARSGHHCWAERYDRSLEDIFELQDEITRKISATLIPELEHAELRRSLKRRTANLTAWDHYARGMAQLHLFTLDGNAAAREQFNKAIELDPDFCDAWTGLGFGHLRDLNLEGNRDRRECVAEGLAAAKRAIACDPDSSQAHLCLGTAYVWSERWDLAMAETELAIQLNPSNAHACMALGNRLDLVGRTEEAITQLETALQLNPRDPRIRIFMRYLARAYLNARNYEKAEEWIRKALYQDPEWPLALYMLATILGHQGRAKEAKAALEECERITPGFVAEHLDWKPYSDPAANEHFHAGLKRIGLAP